jgi:hypothetical protein
VKRKWEHASVPATSFLVGNSKIQLNGGAGNLAINAIAPRPANAGGVNNVLADPSGIGNASKIAPLPRPRINVPVIPQFK